MGICWRAYGKSVTALTEFTAQVGTGRKGKCHRGLVSCYMYEVVNESNAQLVIFGSCVCKY